MRQELDEQLRAIDEALEVLDSLLDDEASLANRRTLANARQALEWIETYV